jgi:hypothetical protein
VGQIRVDQWIALVGGALGSESLRAIATRQWSTGQVVMGAGDQNLVENETKRILNENAAIAGVVISAITLVAGILLAILGLIGAILGVLAAPPTGGVSLAGAVISIIVAVGGLILAVMGGAGLVVSIVQLVASFMPDYLVRSVGTQLAGGNGGNPFLDDTAKVGEIDRIELSYGNVVESIQVFWRDPLHAGQTIAGQRHGGNGPHQTTLTFKQGEYIQKLSGRSGAHLDQFSIHTNHQRFGPYGGNGGSEFEIEPEWGARIVGFQGRAGGYIDAIGGRSEVYGSAQAGGMGGIPFLDALPEKGRLSRISVRSGDYIDAIRVHHRVDGKEVSGKQHGGRGGSLHEIDLGPNEVVTRVWGRCGIYVDSINFDIGDTVTGANRSVGYGGKGAHAEFDLTVPAGKKLSGFWGRADELVDAIGLCTEAA